MYVEIFIQLLFSSGNIYSDIFRLLLKGEFKFG